MPYDPFSTNDNADGTPCNHLLSIRRPPILDHPLTCLEWAPVASRKRPRPETSHESARPDQNSQSTYANNADRRSEAIKSEQAAMHNNKSMKPERPREIIRIVEKPVYFEPTTIMGGPPLVDDRVRQLVSFILQHVTGPTIEIEAKLGVLFEKVKGARAIQLVPVSCETPINKESNSDVHFVSDVGQEMFCKLDQRLHERVEETGSLKEGMVRCYRYRDVDVIYRNKIRQTKRKDDNGTMQVIRTQRKTRLGDMNVLCPGSVFDVRYSASSEEDCALPNSMPEMEREKDRISYKFEYLSVDITTVESRSDVTKQTREVEVEIDPSANLFDEVTKYRNGDDTSKLFDIASSLVNNVRILLEK